MLIWVAVYLLLKYLQCFSVMFFDWMPCGQMTWHGTDWWSARGIVFWLTMPRYNIKGSLLKRISILLRPTDLIFMAMRCAI